MDLTTRQHLQDEEYEFPYHYLPQSDGRGFANGRLLDWGHEYLSYMTHVSELLSDMEWSSLLDVGCGDGRLVDMLTPRFPDRRVLGLDYSERAIRMAKTMCPQGEFTSGDITAKPADRFDGATCVDVIEHIDPGFLPRFVAGMRAHVRDGGFLVVTVPSTNRRLNKKHYQHFTADSLKAVLEPSFKVVECRYLNGSSGALRMLTKLLVNRIYAITDRRILGAFYRHYVRAHLISTPSRGGRVLAICRA